MKYRLEIFLREGTPPMLTMECDDYFVSHDGLRLHIKYGKVHKIVPMNNVLFFSSYENETTNR